MTGINARIIALKALYACMLSLAGALRDGNLAPDEVANRLEALAYDLRDEAQLLAFHRDD